MSKCQSHALAHIIFSAERRKTWSGTPSKSDEEQPHDKSADNSFVSNHSDANNNSYSNDTHTYDGKSPLYSGSYDRYPYDKSINNYDDDKQEYFRGDNSYMPNSTNSYYESNYNATSYFNSRPNFKIW